MPDVVLHNLTKRYRRGVVAVDDLSLRVASGELLVILGPSGCGKTTTLRLIAGLERPDAGRVEIGGRDVTGLPPAQREVAMVFQEHSLYPHMTVRRNLAFPLRQQRLAKAEIASRVDDAAAMLGLGDLLDRKPGELSGGERQRAALGRVLVRRPACALLDEPLSQLDAPLRRQLQEEIRALHRHAALTVVHVTHDQDEALRLGDRIAVMAGGRLQQVDEPRMLLGRPANRFVASFVGDPPMNLLDATIVKCGDALCARFGGGAELRLPRGLEDAAQAWVERRVTLGVPPAAMRVATTDDAMVELVDVERQVAADSTVRLRGRLPDGTAATVIAPTCRGPSGKVPISVEAERVQLFAPGPFGVNLGGGDGASGGGDGAAGLRKGVR